MQTIEFETELNGKDSLPIPADVAASLPKRGTAKVILRVQEDADDTRWRQAAHEQFLRDDNPEDSVYDKYL